MARYVIVLGSNADLFGDVRRTLLADSRFIDAGDTIHCDGAAAPLTNIYAVDMNPAEWELWDSTGGMPDPRTMSTLMLECRSPAWVSEVGEILARAIDDEVGHAQLLLRSVKGDHHASRIDVLFKAVEAIDLPTKFDGLQIERDGDQYAVSGVGWFGRVIAGACFQAEDAGEYYNPSPFAHSMPGA